MAQSGLNAGRIEVSERAGDSGKKWNEELYTMLGMAPSQDKYEAIATFVSDFTYAATLYSQVIISEVCLLAIYFIIRIFFLSSSVLFVIVVSCSC
jgi:hypothetical protein